MSVAGRTSMPFILRARHTVCERPADDLAVVCPAALRKAAKVGNSVHAQRLVAGTCMLALTVGMASYIPNVSPQAKTLATSDAGGGLCARSRGTPIMRGARAGWHVSTYMHAQRTHPTGFSHPAGKIPQGCRNERSEFVSCRACGLLQARGTIISFGSSHITHNLIKRPATHSEESQLFHLSNTICRWVR